MWLYCLEAVWSLYVLLLRFIRQYQTSAYFRANNSQLLRQDLLGTLPNSPWIMRFSLCFIGNWQNSWSCVSTGHWSFWTVFPSHWFCPHMCAVINTQLNTWGAHSINLQSFLCVQLSLLWYSVFSILVTLIFPGSLLHLLNPGSMLGSTWSPLSLSMN